MKRFIFVRHGETVKDPAIDPREWVLVPEALEGLEREIGARVFEGASVLVTSEEHKAIATARPIAGALKLSPVVIPEFNEIARDKEFLSDEEFARAKRAQLEQPEFVGSGGESASMALTRFQGGLAKLEEIYADKTIVIVTHGTVLALYFMHLHEQADNPVADKYTYWRAIPFCGIGIINNNTIIQDISPV